MKLNLNKYKCRDCNHEFKFPNLIGNSYGEFLYRSKSGGLAYLFALHDSFFKEVLSVARRNIRIAQIDDYWGTKIFHRIFYIACDPDDFGYIFSTWQQPPCPLCGEINVGHYGPIYPLEIVDMDIPDITHERWDKLSMEEKELKVDRAIEKVMREDEYFRRL